MKNANDYFRSHTGSETVQKHAFTTVRYTEGVQDLAETCGAYWMLDLVASYQHKLYKEEFQTWEFKRDGDSFVVTATDGNGNVLATQDIEYSDFNYDILTLWFVNKVLMLPSEY